MTRRPATHQAAHDTAIYLVDASVYVFRAWFSIPGTLTNAKKEPINAVHGFAGFVADFLKRTNARYVAFAFDESLSSSFRNEIDPNYKANRESAPEELKRQFQYCRELIEALGMVHLAHERYEADDFIATLAKQASKEKRDCLILSRDKDLTQLVNSQTQLWDYASDITWDTQAVIDKFGVPPSAMIDYQALIGDSVDNISGVKGIGPKAAAQLISEYKNLDNIYANIEAIPDLPIRGAKRIATLLKDGQEDAYRCHQLVTLLTNIPNTVMPSGWKTRQLEALYYSAPDPSSIQAICQKTGLGKGICERLQAVTTTLHREN